MNDKCITIEQLKNEITANSIKMQEITSRAKSEINQDITFILDDLMRLNSYNIAAIVEYLENNS